MNLFVRVGTPRCEQPQIESSRSRPSSPSTPARGLCSEHAGWSQSTPWTNITFSGNQLFNSPVRHVNTKPLPYQRVEMRTSCRICPFCIQRPGRQPTKLYELLISVCLHSTSCVPQFTSITFLQGETILQRLIILHLI